MDMLNPVELTDNTMTASCPMHTIETRYRMLNTDDELIFPMHKRAIVQYAVNTTGIRELYIYYGDKEISFDKPELFEFGENLAKQPGFVAISATGWGNGYEWTQIQPLLEQLIDEGILQYADTYEADTLLAQESSKPSPLRPALTTKPRSWLECVAITSELTGRTLDLAYLELVIPVFRVAHIALDAEGRQVGEANVFPKPLRLDVPTEWRTCPFPGSRYQDERPMNVTALKSMRTYWSQMMVALLHIREAYLQRFPDAQNGWTVGGLEALSTLVLAVPTYQLMRTQHGVANGQLHPALSSMFRATDGLRVVMHQMIFVPVGEPTLSPSAPMTSGEIYEYSERNYAFSSEHGVCAGPKAMIEEFLNVLVNGVSIKGADSVVLEPAVQAALDNLKPAFDYGLYGLQAYAAVFSIWPVMTRTYGQLWALVESSSDACTDTITRFRERLQTQINILNIQTYHSKEEWRLNREQTYSEIYAHCAIGLGLDPEEKSLTERIAPVMEAHHGPVFQKLRMLLQTKCCKAGATNSPDIEMLLSCLMNYFLQVQAILSLADKAQQQINKLLGRTAPKQPFDAAEINIHNLLQGDADKRLAYLTDVLEEIFGIRIFITKDSIDITEINGTI